MQTAALHNLEGRLITGLRKVHDYLQIAFGNDVGLSIYNDITIYPCLDISELVGKRFETSSQTDRYIELRFSGEVVLRIDLSPQASYGPEVAELNRKGLASVVWNQPEQKVD